jgi:hypothetical protein
MLYSEFRTPACILPANQGARRAQDGEEHSARDTDEERPRDAASWSAQPLDQVRHEERRFLNVSDQEHKGFRNEK